MDPGVRAETERWFRRRGLPHFISGRVATRDVWNRTLPFLVVVFLLESLNAVNLESDWEWWVNALALAGGLGLAVGVWVVLNRLRHEPAFALPTRLGPVELGVFVLVPPFVPLVFGAQAGSAVLTFAANLVILGLAYVVVSYGIVSMIGWGLVQLGRQSTDVLAVVVRALPLLLLFATFIFVNAEAWQFTSELPWWVLGLVGGLLFVVGALFAVLKVPSQISELARPAGDGEVETLVAGTPVASLPGPVGAAPALSRRQWRNVGLVITVSEGIQVLLVTAFVFAFYTFFGVLAISPSVVVEWIGDPPHELVTWTVGGHAFVVTQELLKVAAFVALFSGLYFTVALLTDATYREEFLDELVGEVRQAFAVRRLYLAELARSEPGGSAAADGTTTGGG